MPSNIKDRYISEYRAEAARFMDSMEALHGLDQQYDALDYGGSGGTSLVDGDFVGANAGITKAEFVAAVGAIRALRNSAASNNNFETKRTDLYKIHSR